MRIALPYQMIITPIDAYPMQHICGMPGSDSPGIRNITISLLIETDSVIQPESMCYDNLLLKLVKSDCVNQVMAK